MADQIEETVEETVDQNEEVVEEITEETVEEEIVETEDNEGESEEESDELSDEDVATAKELIKKLRTPGDREALVKSLAEQFGIKFGVEKKDETVVQDKTTKTKRSIKDIVDEKLPPQWKAMGPILTEVLESINSEYIAPQFTATQEEKHLERVEAARAWAVEKYSDYEALGPKMAEIAQEVAPAKLNNLDDYKKYVDRIYKLAKGSDSDGSLASKVAKIVQKTNKNAKRAKPGPSDVSQARNTVTAKTPEEAIKLAMKQLKMS